MALSLQTLPVETVYRILDHLTDQQLFMSTSNICQRMNAIINSYPRYQVKIPPFTRCSTLWNQFVPENPHTWGKADILHIFIDTTSAIL